MDIPTTYISKEELPINILDLLVKCNLATSKSDARRLIKQGTITVYDGKLFNSKQRS
jgi:tyrosyl-tRNA synthetase